MVPEFPGLLLPPQPTTPMETQARSTPSTSHRSRFLGTVKSTREASAVPPVGQSSLLIVLFSAFVGAVVATVSVAVCAVVPLRVTLVGFRLHVGMSVTPVMAVVTLHARLTLPLNPSMPITLIVPVFPVVAPGITVMDVVPPLPAVKLGGAVIVSAMLAEAVIVPDVPVMVTVTGLEVTAADAFAVKVTT